MEVPASFASVPRSALYAIAPFVLVALILSFIRAYTTWNYYRRMRQITSGPGKPGKTIPPPQIPYTLPYLGNALSFLNTTPGAYWHKLFSWHPRSSGACTLLLGGKKTHIVFTPHIVQAIFKNKTMKRDVFEHELFQKVFSLPEEQIANAEAGKHHEHEMNAAYLTKFDRVNELTETFTRVLDEVLAKDAEEIVKKDSIGLYDWLRDRMFTASTTALLGEEILKMYPEYCEDFFKFDQEFLGFFFDLPNIMMRDAIARRDRILKKLQAWGKAMQERSGGSPIDPEGPAWEPLFGSRLNRARQLDYKKRNLNARSGAAFDLGMTFGLSSNAIPATNWMLLHIINPKGDPTLYKRVMADILKVQNPDGSIHTPTLIALPLLQSIWTETLRLYTDVLVTRNLSEDVKLPLDEDGKTFIEMKKGDNVFAPSYIGHHDPAAWSGQKNPSEEFWAERFLAPDPANPGQEMFSITGTNGKFYPFGGGRTICPGRVFAKQEALGALAMVLLRFEFEFLGFVDKSGKATDNFVKPGSNFPGSGALMPGGDMKVKVLRRQRLN
ncbi:hypothetical protein LTR37_002856 [Vermiconidia calcicola]|uniref:Uncharacterized protein n=1 Tax=Vermiconidia calcicola TaxID=1690605 RepID=A0ACC3NSS6_9PEZI|nr:hypothetical protein LTR37_002856 [Vermiconidia calcicola]